MKSKISAFKRAVWRHYQKSGRVLPWRKVRDPYKILVSEIMLQQTQVSRVVPYYEKFLKKFPNIHSLAKAPLSDVLRVWQGLGYNRRAKMLHGAAQIIVSQYGGEVPPDYESLTALPGVGEYTAKAVRTFAYNEPEAFIETNIRSALIHYFFPHRKGKVSDKALLPYVVRTLDKSRPREWCFALMDYGAHLKTLHPNPSRKSTHYTKQKPFKGSDREIRGAIIRKVLEGKVSAQDMKALAFSWKRVEKQLKNLTREGLLMQTEQTYFFPTS